MHFLPLETTIANRAVGELARSARPDAPVRPVRRDGAPPAPVGSAPWARAA